MGEHTFILIRGGSQRAYAVWLGGRTVGTVTCVDDLARKWVARLGPEERRCLDSHGEEIAFWSRNLAAAVVVAAADAEAEGGP